MTHLKISRVPHVNRFAARDDRFPNLVGYGDSPDEAVRDLEDKLPRRAPRAPDPPAVLPLSPAHGLFAMDREERPRTDDALDRAYRVGNFEGNRRRH